MTDDLSSIAKSIAAESAEITERLRQSEVQRIIERIGTESDESLADIAAIAAQICMVPVSTITLIDDVKQYIKGMVGMSEEVRVLNRFEGICNITIQSPDTNTIFYDASVDDRIKGLPVVDGTYDYIKFYAGLPLVTPSGFAIGSMCVIDRMPRKLRKDQLQAVERLRKLALRILLGN